MVKNQTPLCCITTMVVCGSAVGKVKSIIGSDGSKLKSAEPSFAVEILGLSSVPDAGETFQVVKNDKEAREIASFRESKLKDRKVLKQRDESLGNIFESMGQSDKKILNGCGVEQSGSSSGS